LSHTFRLPAPVNQDHHLASIGAAVRACKRNVRTPVLVEVGDDCTPGPKLFASGDLNGDGVADLVIPNSTLSFQLVSVLLGNSDGTFQGDEVPMRSERERVFGCKEMAAKDHPLRIEADYTGGARGRCQRDVDLEMQTSIT